MIYRERGPVVLRFPVTGSARSEREASYASAFVGRGREMAALRQAFAAPPVVVAVEGEAGIGKSRFVAEFLASAAAPARCLLACCPPYRQPHTLGAVVDSVRQAAADLSWLTILVSGLIRRFDLHVLGWWELDLRTNLAVASVADATLVALSATVAVVSELGRRSVG